MNLTIVLINILVFIVFSLIGSTTDTLFMLDHGAQSAYHLSVKGEYYRLFTSMFLHFGIQHIFNNMLLLIYAGDMLETIVGKWRYLIIYLGGGLIGNLFSWYKDCHLGRYVASAGASGAIFAVLGALIWLAILNRKRIDPSFIKRLILVSLLSLADGYTQTGIDNAAHTGGFLGGLILCMLLHLSLMVRGKVRKENR